MQLRDYQLSAVTSLYEALKYRHHPVAQLATGTGKSLIIAEILRREREAGRRVWVLTHSQQLVKQNAETYYKYTQHKPGIVCSGLKRADYDDAIIFATIQSIITPALRGGIPQADLIIIDEAHRISHKTGEVGMYGRIFNRYPAARRLAMTATPWRMDGGLIYGKDSDVFWFDNLAYKYTVPQAVAAGWLAPLIGVETEVQLNLEGLTVTDGDINQQEVTERVTNDWLRAVAASLGQLASRRKHIALYAPTVVAAMRAQAMIHEVLGWQSQLITGATGTRERDDILQRWRQQEFKVLCSVDTLTTGFDFPALDCIACLRPTQSSSLWVQIQGRGTRLSPDKKNCLLLDYVGNLQRLGGVDMLETYVKQAAPEVPVEAEPAPVRESAPRQFIPGVRSLIPIDPMTGEQAADGSLLTVTVHTSNSMALPLKRQPGSYMLMRSYECTTTEGARVTCSAFLMCEAPTQSREWAKATAQLAVWRVAAALPIKAKTLQWQAKVWPRPTRATVRKQGKYWNVIEEFYN